MFSPRRSCALSGAPLPQMRPIDLNRDVQPVGTVTRVRTAESAEVTGTAGTGPSFLTALEANGGLVRQWQALRVHLAKSWAIVGMEIRSSTDCAVAGV